MSKAAAARTGAMVWGLVACLHGLAHLHEAARGQVAPAHVRLDQARAAQQRQRAPPLPPNVQRLRSTQVMYPEMLYEHRLRSTQSCILKCIPTLGVLELLCNWHRQAPMQLSSSTGLARQGKGCSHSDVKVLCLA